MARRRLTDQGVSEAREAGRLLKAEADLDLRVVHTSLLTRAIRTADLALDEAGRSWLPVRRHWRLNERHYGALQGHNKKETAERHGPETVQGLAPQLLDPAAGGRAGRRTAPGRRSALSGRPAGRPAGHRVPGRRGGPHHPLLGGQHRA